MLAACEPEPKGPVQVAEPEAMRFDTEHIRQEVDDYKTTPSVAARRRVEEAFEAFDEKVRELEEQAQAQSGPERTATEQRIAALKQRRALHWERAQTASVETLPVQRAEPVGERVEKAESVSRSERARKAGRSREEQSQRTRRAEPVREPQNFFQRFFR